MAHLNELLDDIVRGEDRELPRTVDLTPIEDTLAKAWFTVKVLPTDDDADAIFQKVITTVVSADGNIDEPGTGDPLTGHLYFLLPSADTLLLEADTYYYYDLKGKSSTGAKKVLEGGRLIVAEQVTQAES